jgi:ISXO2 transposase-like protein
MPAAIAAQNRRRSSRPATGGRPGENNGARPDQSDRRFRPGIATSFRTALRRPLESTLYPAVGAEFAKHETGNHSAKEYAREDVTTNSVEGFFGIFKRGMTGVYQHCGEQHFQRYLDEFVFRYSKRSKLGVEDAEHAALAIRGAEGKRLTYQGSAPA